MTITRENLPQLVSKKSILDKSVNTRLSSVDRKYFHKKNSISLNNKSIKDQTYFNSPALENKGGKKNKNSLSINYNEFSYQISTTKSSSLANTLKTSIASELDLKSKLSITKSNKFRLEELLKAIKNYSKIKVESPLLKRAKDKKIIISEPINNQQVADDVFDENLSSKEELEKRVDTNSPSINLQPRMKAEDEYRRTVKFLKSIKKESIQEYGSKVSSPVKTRLSPIRQNDSSLPLLKVQTNLLNSKMSDTTNFTNKMASTTFINDAEPKLSCTQSGMSQLDINNLDIFRIQPLNFNKDTSDSDSNSIEQEVYEKHKDKPTSIKIFDEDIAQNKKPSTPPDSQPVLIDDLKEISESKRMTSKNQKLMVVTCKKSSKSVTFNLEEMLMVAKTERKSKTSFTKIKGSKKIKKSEKSLELCFGSINPSNQSSSKDDLSDFERPHAKVSKISLSNSEIKTFNEKSIRKSNLKNKTCCNNLVKKTMTMMDMPINEEPSKPIFRHMSFKKTKTFLQSKCSFNQSVSFTDSSTYSNKERKSIKSSGKDVSRTSLEIQKYDSINIENDEDSDLLNYFILEKTRSILFDIVNECSKENEVTELLIPNFYNSALKAVELAPVIASNNSTKKKLFSKSINFSKPFSMKAYASSSFQMNEDWIGLCEVEGILSNSFSYRAFKMKTSKSENMLHFHSDNRIGDAVGQSMRLVESERKRNLNKISKITQKNLVRIQSADKQQFQDYKSYLISMKNKYFNQLINDELKESKQRIQVANKIKSFKCFFAKKIIVEIFSPVHLFDQMNTKPIIQRLENLFIPKQLKAYFISKYYDAYNLIVAYINKFKFHKRSVNMQIISNSMENSNFRDFGNDNGNIDFTLLNQQNKLKLESITNIAKDSCAKTHWFFQKDLLREAGFQFNKMKSDEKRLTKVIKQLTLAPQRTLNSELVEEESSSTSLNSTGQIVSSKSTQDFKLLTNFNKNQDTGHEIKPKKYENSCKLYLKSKQGKGKTL